MAYFLHGAVTASTIRSSDRKHMSMPSRPVCAVPPRAPWPLSTHKNDDAKPDDRGTRERETQRYVRCVALTVKNALTKYASRHIRSDGEAAAREEGGARSLNPDRALLAFNIYVSVCVVCFVSAPSPSIFFPFFPSSACVSTSISFAFRAPSVCCLPAKPISPPRPPSPPTRNFFLHHSERPPASQSVSLCVSICLAFSPARVPTPTAKRTYFDRFASKSSLSSSFSSPSEHLTSQNHTPADADASRKASA